MSKNTQLIFQKTSAILGETIETVRDINMCQSEIEAITSNVNAITQCAQKSDVTSEQFKRFINEMNSKLETTFEQINQYVLNEIE